jgi:hypothetical protein
MLAPACKKVTGVDVAEEAISYAREKADQPNLSYVLSDFFENTIHADVVVSFETIEHIKVDSMDVVLSKLLSFTNRTIIGSVPYLEKESSNPHHYFFSLNESNIDILRPYGEIEFFYQKQNGKIFQNKPSDEIQNLLFVFVRTKAS